MQSKLPPAEFTQLSQYPGPFNYAIYEAHRDGKPVTAMMKTAGGTSQARNSQTAEALARAAAQQAQEIADRTMADQRASGKNAGPGGKTAPALPLAPPPSPEQMKQAATLAVTQFGKAQEALLQEGRELPLPGRPESFTFMNSGMRMAVWFPDLLKVGVFNLAALKFDGFVDTKDPKTLVASGGSVLAVYQPSTRTVDLYDSSTLQKRAGQVVSGVEATPISTIAMGLHQPMQIYALCKTAPQNNLMPAVIRLPGFTLQPMQVQQRRQGFYPFNSMEESALTFVMDESGLHGAATRPTVSPTGLATYNVKNDGGILYDYKHYDARAPWPTKDGQKIITNNGVFTHTSERSLDTGGNRSEQVVMSTVVVGYDATVSLVKPSMPKASLTGFRVSNLTDNATIVELTVGNSMLNKIPGADYSRKGFIMASAPADRIVCGGVEEKRIVVFPLGLRGSTGAGGSMAAQPGKLFEKKVTLPAGASATLETGPAGLTYDAATMTLRWEVPATQARGQSVQVLLLVKKADGSQDYQIEKIPVP